MNKAHAAHDAPTPRRGIVRAWMEFWFTPTDPIGLHAVRFLSGLLFLAWLLAFAGEHAALFGLGGWFDEPAYREASRQPDGTPAPITWSVLYLAGSDPTLLTALYWASVVALVFFTLGVAPQGTALLAWVVIASYTANPAISYDADTLLIVLAFYLMIGYLLFALPRPGQPWRGQFLVPPISWLLGRAVPGADAAPSVAANFTLRLLQVHFALIVCVSGFHKLQYAEWWAGANFWYALHPAFETTLDQSRRHAPNARFYLTILSLGAYLGLAWQITYPVFAWRPRWRIVLLGGAAVGWLATAFLYRLPLFGPAILIGSLAFLTAAEWRGALGWLLRLPGLRALSGWLPATADALGTPRSRQREAVAATAPRAR